MNFNSSSFQIGQKDEIFMETNIVTLNLQK